MVAPKDVGRSVGLRHPGNFWLQKALFLQDGVIGPVNGSPGSRKRGEVRDGTGSGFFPMVLAPLFLATGTDLIIYGKLAQAADRLTAFCASKLH